MISLNELIALIYTTIIVSFVWARFRFFRIAQETPSGITKLYDPFVAVHIAIAYVHIFSEPIIFSPLSVLSVLLFLSALFLFWWSIVTAKVLGFALSDKIARLLVTGPYAWVRHPFYTSYTLVWVGGSILFNSMTMWITLLYLIAFYYRVAIGEENIILKSQYSREYEAYREKVGMFLPRITKWKK